MPNYASALGEAVGKLIEVRMGDLLTPIAESCGYYYDRGGARPGIRPGKTLCLANASGIRYRIDGVIEDAGHQPIVLFESKYLRYQKHNRDKASWTCVAHYNLHKNFPTVRKSIAVLTGQWTAQSKSLMRSFGIELHEVPFDHIADTLGASQVEFRWHEKDSMIAERSFRHFQSLLDEEKRVIGTALLSPIADGLMHSVREALILDPNSARRLREIEVLIKTTENEFYPRVFATAADAIRELTKLVAPAEDIAGRL